MLSAAAALAGCDIHLAQVMIEESGSVEHDGYESPSWRRYRGHDEDEGEDLDDGFEVSEVVERSATVSDWRRPDGSPAPMGVLPLHDNELCPPGALDDADPDEQHFHEATGNEGASFERSYRRAALVLWPRARRLAVISQGALAGTLG